MQIYIISGEGEQGHRELYTGKKSVHAIKIRLTKERRYGDRWAEVEIDGNKVSDREIGLWMWEGENGIN